MYLFHTLGEYRVINLDAGTYTVLFSGGEPSRLNAMSMSRSRHERPYAPTLISR